MTETFTCDGTCPNCGSATTYRAENPWFRDYLTCWNCPGGSVPRERAIAWALNTFAPSWRTMRTLECAPSSNRGVSLRTAAESQDLTVMNYFPDEVPGVVIYPEAAPAPGTAPEASPEVVVGQDATTAVVAKGVHNQNLEQMTFPNASFELFIASDVLEHVTAPDAALAEIGRVLKKGGIMIMTFPMRNFLVEPTKVRARLNADGSIEHLTEPEIHGNPFDESGSLVFTDFGYDIHKAMAEWSGLDIMITRFASPSLGLLGEYTDVVIGWKSGFESTPEV